MVMEILVIMCGRLRTAGLLNTPEHFHNAQMYSTHFRYLDPVDEGKRLAIIRDLLGHFSLSQVSWAIDLDCVTENDQLFQWHGADQIIPLDRDLKEYFAGQDYLQAVQEAKLNFHYRLDEKKWQQKAKELDNYPSC
jgi:hypothetical protein